MSRSRGRGTKPKRQVQPKRGAEPFMMFQVFDGYPWVEVRWREQAVPDKLGTDSLVSELVSVVQRHVAEAEKRAADDVEADEAEARADRLATENEVRVSGVPYAVPVKKVNGTDVIDPRERNQPVYPY